MYKNIFFIILGIISFPLGQSLKGNITDINKDVLSGLNIIIKGEIQVSEIKMEIIL